MAPDGGSFVTGNGKGRLHRYEVGASKEGAAMVLEGSKAELHCQGSSHNEGIDCIVSGQGACLLLARLAWLCWLAGEGRISQWGEAETALPCDRQPWS